MNRHTFAQVVCLAIALVVPRSVCAQQTLGLPPFGSFSGGPFDTINNANLNIHFLPPILRKAGRGLPLEYSERYDSTAFTIMSGAWTPNTLTIWGWLQYAFDSTFGFAAYAHTQGSCNSGGQIYYYNIYSSWLYKMPANPGYQVQFSFSVSDASVNTPCTGAPPYSATATAIDGSGVTITANAAPSATVSFRSGNTLSPVSLQYGGQPTTLTDTNGNQISGTTPGSVLVTDTLGTTAVDINGGGTPSNPITFQYTDSSNTSQTVTMNYTAFTVQTNFGCSGIGEYGPTSVDLPTSMTYPDGTSYSFAYEVTPGDNHNPHYVTGRLASVTLPTGGTISYTYTGGANGINCSLGTASGLTRTTPDGTWTYTQSGTWPAMSTTIDDPEGNQTVLDFQGIYETEREIYSGSSTLIETIYTCYNGATYPCNSTSITLPISQITKTVAWASGQTSQAVTSYNSYGLPTEIDEYGYGNGSVGGLVRKKLISYASLGNNINDRVSTITIENGSGTTVQSTSNAYGNTVTGTSGTPQHISVSGARGNMVSTTTAGLTRSYTYYDTGAVASATDTNSNTTSYAVTSCGNSFATSISFPMSLSRSLTWNCNGSAQKASETDENGKTTDYSYDLMNRPTQTTFPDGGWNLTSYTGATEQDVYTGITSTTPSTGCAGCRHDHILLDSLGRQSSTTLESDPQGATAVASTYDSAGRLYTTSNPYRSTSDPTYGLDTRAYDGLNRVTSVTHADGNVAQTLYGSNVGTHGGASAQICSTGNSGVGYPTLFVDEAGIKHQAWSDALGRTIEADEADSSNNMTIGTCYAYDALDDLTQIAQGSQTRSYSYNAVPQLTSETTPEGGTTSFYYTTSGGAPCSGDPREVCRRTDARSITTTYSYDALNRLTAKTYSDGTPTATFYHDQTSAWGVTLTNPLGRLTETTTGSTGELYSYDAMGRRTAQWQCTPYNCGSGTWQTSYSYDLAGDLAGYTHPAGFTVTNTISNAQRITEISSSLSDSTHPGTLAQNITYAPPGGMTGLLDGCVGSGCVQSQETYDYNNRLQAVRIQLGTSGTPNANNCLVYNYYSGVPNPASCAIPSQGSSGNDGSQMGHLFQDTTNSSLGHTAALTYDNMMRLATSVATGSATYNLTFSYDRYGNVTCTTNGSTNGPCANYTFNTSTNQITNTGFSYDAAGNLTADGTGTGTHTYQWDAESRLVSVDGVAGQACQSTWTACYVYNALGERVEKNVGGTYTEIAVGLGGEELGYNNRTLWTESWVNLGRRHLAHYQNSETYFTHANTLGTTAQVTDYTGTMVQDELHYPWGQQWGMVGASEEERFASLRHRDAETGLDPTRFRIFSSTAGRWMSPDPLGGSVGNPQSLNRYAYVVNNPASFIDPLGLFMSRDQLEDQAWEELDEAFGGGGDYIASPVEVTEAGSGGGTTSTSKALLNASEKRVAQDLGKSNCAADFASPLAPCISALSSVQFGNLGPISPDSFEIAEVTGAQVTLNSQVNWGNPQGYLIQFAEQQTSESSVSSTQFMDLAILHELEHYQGTLGNPDTDPSIMHQLWVDCIQ